MRQRTEREKRHRTERDAILAVNPQPALRVVLPIVPAPPVAQPIPVAPIAVAAPVVVVPVVDAVPEPVAAQPNVAAAIPPVVPAMPALIVAPAVVPVEDNPKNEPVTDPTDRRRSSQQEFRRSQLGTRKSKEEPPKEMIVKLMPGDDKAKAELKPPDGGVVAPIDTSKPRKEYAPLMDKDEEKMLLAIPFYHGYLPREDVVMLLNNCGDFLLRVSEVDDETNPLKTKRQIILSMAIDTDELGNEDDPNDGRARNAIVRRGKAGKYKVEKGVGFDTVVELTEHYKSHRGYLGIAKKTPFYLNNAVLRQEWECLHRKVRLTKVLGSGAFGEVRAGTLKKKTGRIVDVAVKMTKGTSNLSKEQIKALMTEARLMRNFRHPNVVRLYGVAVDIQPIYIILELLTGGSLNGYLTKNAGKLSESTKASMSLGAARGVEYIHKMDCIHRDIAARNCLLNCDNVVKISDFGMSKMGATYHDRDGKRLPIKWLAPEALETLVFSQRTDIFSYGVMCFEIWSEGADPWKGTKIKEVKEAVLAGRHLPIPPSCPEKFRLFIEERIFATDPAKRPTMTETCQLLEQMGARQPMDSKKSSQPAPVMPPTA